MGVRAHAAAAPRRAPIRSRGPGLLATTLVALAAFVLLVANGRPLAAPPASGLSAAVLSAALALAGAALELDADGSALIGKALASLFAALAAAALFDAAARRHGPGEGRWAGFTLALGTTLAAAAQAWSGEPAATACVAVALVLLVRADEEDRAGPAVAAGVPLGLAVAFQPSAAILALVLVAFVLARFRAAALLVLAAAAPGALLALLPAVAGGATGLAAATGAPASAPSGGALALVASPVRGILLFAPAVIVGLAGIARALRARPSRLWDQAQPGRFLPAACLAAALAHLAWIAVAGGFDASPFWGPRLVAPACALLLLFLPEGFAVLKLAATLLVVASIGVQALGLLSYDGRWDRLQGPAAAAAAWDFSKSPIAFHARERSARVALPSIEGRRLVARPRVFSPGGGAISGAGSFVSFARRPPAPDGVEKTFDGLRFEGEARVRDGKLVLEQVGEGVAFQVREGARPRRLELRVVGRGKGRIGVGESGGRGETRWREQDVSGAFRLRFAYFHAESGGPDLRVVLRSGGPVAIESLALVPPSEPDDVLRLP